MLNLIFLQADGLPSALLELAAVIPEFFNYVLKSLNILLIIWVLIVLFLFYSVPSFRLSAFAGTLFGILQSLLVFSIENQIIACNEASGLLWFATIINLINLFSPIIFGASLIFIGKIFNSLNPIWYSLSVLIFSAVTFLLIDSPYNYQLFQFDLVAYFSDLNFLKSILPIIVCN